MAITPSTKLIEFIMAGYFQADRSLAQAFLPKHGTKFTELEAYVFLTSFAAFAPRDESVGSKLISLNVGELVASERYLQSRWGWSRTKVRSFKELLKKRGLLDQREDQRETILKVSFTRSGGSQADHKKTTKDTNVEPRKDQGETNIIRKKNGKGTKKKEPPPELPFDSDKFRSAWDEWIQYLKQKKKTPTPITIKRQLNKLSKLTEDDAIITINKSIDNGWQGLFPPSGGGRKPDGGTGRINCPSSGGCTDAGKGIDVPVL